MRLAAILLSVSFVPNAVAESYLVAPFSNRSKNATLDWMGESLAETVREKLIGTAPMISREERIDAGRRLSLRGAPMSLASVVKVAEAVGADRVVYGDFELAADPPDKPPKKALTIVARVLDRRSAMRLAEFNEQGSLDDLPGLQLGLAWKLKRWLNPRFEQSREEFVNNQPSFKLAAVENYYRGLLATVEDQQHRYFTQAFHIDPAFTQPCFNLGRMHFDKENYREATTWLEKVSPTNGNFLEASFLLGLSQYQLHGFQNAARTYEKLAASLNVPEVWNNLGAALSRQNRPEAFDLFQKALTAEPRDADYHFNVGYLLWKRGSFDTAAERFRSVIERTPDDEDATLLLNYCLKATGPRAGDYRTAGLERLKDSYEDRGANAAQ
ncbi:MAG: tetratricopeptide repeat protein [Bryobacteraceae bacterium]